jgi:hypothetical protein
MSNPTNEPSQEPIYKDRINNLFDQADGHTPFKALAGLDPPSNNASNFQTFGCPCYVLDHCLQSDSGNIPIWESCARTGIYVGRSPSHAANVSLILNLQTRHVFPQYHVVYNDNFMMVPYLHNATVPPHWVELVKVSLMIKLYTEQQVGTWHTLPELDTEIEDFTSDTSSTSCLSINLDGEE